MQRVAALIAFRMLPVILVIAAAIFYVFYVEGSAAYSLRNTLPMLLVVALALVTLVRGGGSWAGTGWCWPLGTIGFAIPAVCLSMYLHYGFSVDLNGMVSESVYPRELFRFLPLYTCVAGGTGFAIGWIVGRNV